ncbi:ABZJ_00895 family protein [Sinorhizobium sp. RAC02]|uniref:ABZJ_00895 family protein n=1 Tax=Sinorhizobium sp. RAC02 TaxID=1842534 RepID=UPI00083E35DF|nr:ABZJ_00895 family protein [Sinorhizobium sp. RAC02]AOF94014.1 putative membrane protein [Sinorhizobium sp. RAC02]
MLQMNDPIHLGRYYLIFAVTNAVVIIAAFAVCMSYEFWVGQVSGTVATGINIGLIVTPAVFVASRFVADQGRVPSDRERSKLAGASLLLAILTSLIATVLLICGALFSALGLAPLSVYGQAIADLWQAFFTSGPIGSPTFWILFTTTTLLALFIILRTYHFAYGRLARRFLQQRLRN